VNTVQTLEKKLVKKLHPKLKSCNEMGQNFNPRKMILLEI
jgi:hypothetical protein